MSGPGDSKPNIYICKIKDEREVLCMVSPQIPSNHGLASEAILGEWAIAKNPDGGPVRVFRRNPAALELIHEVVRQHLPNDPELIEVAREQGDGQVLLLDGRTTDPQGKVAPEDIIGWFEVLNGRIVDDSYQAGPRFTPYTKEHGPMQLTNVSLLQKVLEAMEQACKRTRQNVSKTEEK